MLPPQSIKRLFSTLRGLSEAGIAILYISHKLEEIKAVCHSATILRQGEVVGRVDPRRETSQNLAKMMIGHEIIHSPHAQAEARDDALLRVTGLSAIERDPHATSIKNVSFDVRQGEILGVAGVSGNGQRALIRFLSGEDTLPVSRAAEIEMLGVTVGHLSAREDAISAFLLYLKKDLDAARRVRCH